MATQDIERQDFEQADRLYADELVRLRLLLEASSTLLGSLSVEAMLPAILDLSRRTLAADAYAMWQHDEPRDAWSIAIHSGLSDTYVASAERAVQGRPTTFSLKSRWSPKTSRRPIGSRRRSAQAHAAEGNRSMLAVSAVLRRTRSRHARLLLPRASRVHRQREERRLAAREPRSRRDRGGRALPEATTTRRGPALHRRGQRAARVVAGVRDDAHQSRAPGDSSVCRLVLH